MSDWYFIFALNMGSDPFFLVYLDMFIWNSCIYLRSITDNVLSHTLLNTLLGSCFYLLLEDAKSQNSQIICYIKDLAVYINVHSA